MRFSKDSNGSLLNKTLVEDGLSSVEHYLIQGMKVFIYGTKSSKGSGWIVRLGNGKVLGQFVSNENDLRRSLS
jgi:hypothetical protein